MEAGLPCLVEPGMAPGLGAGMGLASTGGAIEGKSRKGLNHKAGTTTLVTDTPSSNLTGNQMAHYSSSDKQTLRHLYAAIARLP